MCIHSHTHDHSHMCTHDMRTRRPTLQVHAGPASRLHALFSCLPGPPSRPVLALEFSMNPPSRLMSSADSEWHRARRRCGAVGGRARRDRDVGQEASSRESLRGPSVRGAPTSVRHLQAPRGVLVCLRSAPSIWRSLRTPWKLPPLPGPTPPPPPRHVQNALSFAHCQAIPQSELLRQ